MSETLLQNRLLLESIFLLLILGSSSIVSFKALKLFKLSKYRPIKYFGLAFLYMGLAWLFRYFFILFNHVLLPEPQPHSSLVNMLTLLVIFYTVSLGGFHLTYSIIRRTLDKDCCAQSFMPLLHIAALLIGFVDTILLAFNKTEDPYIAFTIQIIVLIFTLIHSYTNRVVGDRTFNLHFLTVVLALVMYLVVFLGELFSGIFPAGELYYGAITAIIFLIVAGETLAIR